MQSNWNAIVMQLHKERELLLLLSYHKYLYSDRDSDRDRDRDSDSNREKSHWTVPFQTLISVFSDTEKYLKKYWIEKFREIRQFYTIKRRFNKISLCNCSATAKQL